MTKETIIEGRLIRATADEGKTFIAKDKSAVYGKALYAGFSADLSGFEEVPDDEAEKLKASLEKAFN